jgi:uncharacterized damage-inducible protein DinB
MERNIFNEVKPITIIKGAAMFRTIDDFLTDWKEETEATVKIFSTLTEDSLNQKIYKEGRTLGRLAWHITGTLGEMPQQSGLKAKLPTAAEPAPATIKQLIRTYEDSSKAVADAVKSQWSDALLAEKVPMYGEEWERGKVLSSLIRHQTHHRAQMTVLMRQAGLKVPGVYGPSREEWQAYGREPEA